MQISAKRISSLFTRLAFQKIEAKVENKIGFIYLNSEKDFNALSVDMKEALANQVN